MKITKRQLRLLIENFLKEEGEVETVSVAAEKVLDYEEYAEKTIKGLKDYVEPSAVKGLKDSFASMYQYLEDNNPGILSKIKNFDDLTTKIAKKSMPFLEKAKTGLGYVAGLALPIAVFSAVPLALYKVVSNLSSVEGKIRNQARAVMSAYNRKLKLSDFADPSGVFAEVSKSFGIKQLKKNEIINSLALETIDPKKDGSTIQRLINDEIIDDSFAQDIYKRAQQIKTADQSRKELIQATFNVDVAQPYHNVALGFASSLLGAIAGSAGADAADTIVDIVSKQDKYLESLKSFVDFGDRSIDSAKDLASYLNLLP